MARIDSRLLSAADEQRINENFCRVLELSDSDAGDIAALFALAKVSVTFDSDGGSEVASQLIPYDTTATEPEDPTKEGYTFVGWLLDADTVLTASWVADEVSEG